MKKALIMMMLAFIGVCGCTQYNGHLGPIFGSWALQEISDDGVVLNIEDNTVFSYQNEVVQIQKTLESPLMPVTRYGNFVKNDNKLIMKFQSEPTESGARTYMAPGWLYFPADESIISFDIKYLDGKKMVIVLTSGSKPLQYTFTRTW